MSDITQNIVITPIDLGVTVNTNQLTFTPDGISLNLYASGGGPATALNANIENVHIYGGTNGYVLQTDGTGNLDWTAMSGGGGGNGTPGGSNTQVQYNDSGSFGGNLGFTFNEVTGNLNVPSNIIAPNFIGNVSVANTALNVAGANVSGYVANATHANVADVANSVAGANISGQVSNSLIAGTVYTNSQPNITSLGTLSALSVTGNISSGNANLGNLTIANFFSGNGSLLSGINGANIIGNTANANYAAYAGNITFAAQPNITSVGRLTDLFITNTRVHLGFQAGYIGSNSTTQGANTVAIGTNAANTTQGANAVAIGLTAGSNGQGVNSIAIGYGAGQSGQGIYATGVGVGAGSYLQGNFACGFGIGAGEQVQGSNATAVGAYAGGVNQGIRSVAIGTSAGHDYQGTYAIAIGANAAYSNQHISSIMLNATGANLNTTQANSLFIKPIRNVTGNVDFTVTLKYNPTTGEIGYV
jgi:hypothetical protein